MFVTFPPYEFRMPEGLVVPGAQHWRLVELRLHLPWFILSVENRELYPGDAFLQTYVFSWESDLVSFLPTVDKKMVRGLMCMAPGWKSASGHWTSHEVREVWGAKDDDGVPFVELRGFDGKLLDVGLRSETPSDGIKRTLLLRQRTRRRRRAVNVADAGMK